MWGLNLLRRADASAPNAGSVAILVAFSLPVLVGMAGAAAETAVWFELKRRAQNAADGAAVAGAIQRARGETANVMTSAKRAATQNGFTNGVDSTTVTINYPPTSGAYAGQPDAVEAIVTRQFTPMLTALFRSTNLTIYARAVAEVKVVGQACVLALSETASTAINVQGSTIANNSGCTVASNSGHASSAVNMAGNATLEAFSVWSAGGFSTPTDTSQLILDEPAKTKMWPLDDPYADVNIPNSLPTCTPMPTIVDDAVTTLTAGSQGTRYCASNANSFNLSGSAIVQMSPGTYFFDAYGTSAGLKAVSGTQISGSGVTIVLMDSLMPSSPATIDIAGGSQVTLTAPTSGTFAGIVIYQDRAATNTSEVNKLNGTSGMELQGAIYIPGQALQYNGDNSAMAVGCVILVANTIDFIGNSTVVNADCASMGVSPVQVTGVRLKE
jgi:hypothetical protein